MLGGHQFNWDPHSASSDGQGVAQSPQAGGEAIPPTSKADADGGRPRLRFIGLSENINPNSH